MVLNEPEGFTVRKQVTRKGKKVMRWVDMRKGVSYLFRYREVSLSANSRNVGICDLCKPPNGACGACFSYSCQPVPSGPG